MSLFTEIPLLLQNEGKLAEIIADLPFSAHVRDTGSNKYILANIKQATNHGLSHTKEVIGLRAKDLNSFELFRKFNYLVETENRSCYFTATEFIGAMRIYQGQHFKWPILNAKGKTTAVFTISVETTKNTDLLILYTFYKQYLPKKIAIDQFLQYLDIKKFFREEKPTDTEVSILFTMRNTSIHKLVAQLMNIKLSSVQTHIKNLRSKLIGTQLEQLLLLLRNFNLSNSNYVL